jgi:hypothetical protein
MACVVLPIKLEVTIDTQTIKAEWRTNEEELAVSSGFIPTA